MKKILGIILSASIFTTMASAAVSVTVEQETVTVSTDITAGERADILVVKKGLDKNDNENI